MAEVEAALGSGAASSAEACPLVREVLESFGSQLEEFVRDFYRFIVIFVEPLLHDARSARPELLGPNFHVPVFLTALKQCELLHTNFLAEFQAKLEAGALIPVWRLFVQYAPLFEIAAQLAGSKQIILAAIDAQAREPTLSFQRYLAECRESEEEYLPGQFAEQAEELVRIRLIARLKLMIQHPIDHFSTYVAMLRRCSQLLPEEHLSGPAFDAAFASMGHTSKVIANGVTASAEREAMNRLESRWQMCFMAPERIFLREGRLTKKSRKADIAYTFLLFSDMLVYGSESGSGVRHHRSIPLLRMNLVQRPQGAEFMVASDDKSFVCVAASPEEKTAWFEAISAAMRELTKSSGESHELLSPALDRAPVWKQDREARGCTLCSRSFTLLNRRHHCRRCGNLVCHGCSEHKVPMNLLVSGHASVKLARCCKRCKVDIGSDCSSLLASPSHAARTSLMEGHMLRRRIEAIGFRRTLVDQGNRGSESFSTASPFSSAASTPVSADTSGIPTPPAAETSGPPGPSMLPQTPTAQMAKTARQRVVEEMLSTEGAYVAHMTNLLVVFVEPILANAMSIHPSFGQICAAMSDDGLVSFNLFLHSVKQIVTLNQQLLAALAERVNDSGAGLWSDAKTVGDIFSDYAPLFSMYSQYSDAQDYACRAILAFREDNEVFADFLAKGEANPLCEGQSLMSYLIMPIQRVPRYQLLLRELKKQTQAQFPDHEDIQLTCVALERIRDSAAHINDVIRHTEKMRHVLELGDQWNRSFSRPGRTLIREGDMQKQCRRRPKEFRFLLFDDALVYGEQNARGGYNFHREIDIRRCALHDMPHEARAFQIHAAKSFVVFCTTSGEKAGWITDLREAMTKAQAQTNALRHASHSDATEVQRFAAVWQADVTSTSCMVCSKEFGIFLRKHHCRSCGDLVCDECSKTRAVLPHIHATDKKRLCDACADDVSAVQDDGDTTVATSSAGSSRGGGGSASSGSTAFLAGIGVPFRGGTPGRSRETCSTKIRRMSAAGPAVMLDYGSDSDTEGGDLHRPSGAGPGALPARSKHLTVQSELPLPGRAIFAFAAAEADQKSLQVGDLVRAFECNGEWLLVQDQKNAEDVGWVPLEYVERS